MSITLTLYRDDPKGRGPVRYFPCLEDGALGGPVIGSGRLKRIGNYEYEGGLAELSKIQRLCEESAGKPEGSVIGDMLRLMVDGRESVD